MSDKAQQEFKATVMPKVEQVQSSQGLPGLHIPKNAADIKEFSEIRNVDAKQLNAQIKAEAEKKIVQDKVSDFVGK
ncbi:uncharacterized protein SAPINGB_P001580 [Magnusiomyces paraingens]|uniref:Uncharacterized protein n=1 Tax=Magnusiomyces paraingens TaxID=2606893 RepID=A0A5E8B8M5_9ASCO|nr:uncharacterized protein SAPINGB_P001580 [Saprochaete ingens]VVT47175.1 unnamed protein product [Saprochaete ingens]